MCNVIDHKGVYYEEIKNLQDIWWSDTQSLYIHMNKFNEYFYLPHTYLNKCTITQKETQGQTSHIYLTYPHWLFTPCGFT